MGMSMAMLMGMGRPVALVTHMVEGARLMAGETAWVTALEMQCPDTTTGETGMFTANRDLMIWRLAGGLVVGLGLPDKGNPTDDAWGCGFAWVAGGGLGAPGTPGGGGYGDGHVYGGGENADGYGGGLACQSAGHGCGLDNYRR